MVSPGMVCCAEKQVKPFWSSSLGQMVQFDTIIFCRTFKNYFGQFVWIEKKVTIIVAFHFMKRRLKMRILKQSRSAEKCKTGPFELFTMQFVAKYGNTITMKGDPSETKIKKDSQCRIKIEREDP